MDSVIPEELAKLIALAAGIALFAGPVGSNIAEVIKDMLSQWITLNMTTMKAISGVISVVVCVYILTKPQFGVPIDLAIMAAVIAIYAGEKWHNLLRS